MSEPMTGTVTDMIQWVKAWDELLKIIEKAPPDQWLRMRELANELGEVIVLNVDLETACRNWLKAMPEKQAQLDDAFRKLGWTQDLGGY